MDIMATTTEDNTANLENEATKLIDFAQGRGPEDADVSQDGSNDSSMKRKLSDREPESPGQEPTDKEVLPFKKERTYYEGMDTDSPSSYPKHVMVPSAEKKPEEQITNNMDTMQPPHSESFPDVSPDRQLQDTSFEPHPCPTYSPEEERPSDAAFSPDKMNPAAQVLTPDSVGRGRPSGGHASFEAQQMFPPNHQAYPDVYRAPSYTQEMDYGRSYGSRSHSGGQPHSHPQSHSHSHSHSSGGASYGNNVNANTGGDPLRPRRWACDYCNVATFLSYEEACAHEEACSRRHQDGRYPDHHQHQHHQSSGANYGGHSGGMGGPVPPQQGRGLGALYHASQEVVTPPTPHSHQPNRWSSRGPPLPVLPHEQGYYRQGHQGHYDPRDDPAQYHHSFPPPDPHYHPQPHHNYNYHPGYHPNSQQGQHKRMLLAMPADSDSLSDRQCYVRAEMVEIFAATEKDVSARHSKGAQKLVAGQVGIRCNHCRHLRPRDRAERAVCYPSSISRIYQTVADMQRFHFEQCREIPDHVRQVYKKLKTTRPRGVGSPQSYWVSSAKTLGLVDTGSGIRFDTDVAKEQQQMQSTAAEVPTATF